jgi:hypothetical protein
MGSSSADRPRDHPLCRPKVGSGAGCIFESVAGSDAAVALPRVGISVLLAALYERSLPRRNRRERKPRQL